jgi:hypothetical protein
MLVTLWFNRQLEALRVRVGVKTDAIEAPLGVSGYRIDVRMPDDPARNKFESLCRAFSVDANGARAPLRFPAAPARRSSPLTSMTSSPWNRPRHKVSMQPTTWHGFRSILPGGRTARS